MSWSSSFAAMGLLFVSFSWMRNSWKADTATVAVYVLASAVHHTFVVVVVDRHRCRRSRLANNKKIKEPLKWIIISHYMGFSSFVSLPLVEKISIESRCLFLFKERKKKTLCWKKLHRNFLECALYLENASHAIAHRLHALVGTSWCDTWWWEPNSI